MHPTQSPTTPIDTLVNTLDNALRTLFAAPHASTACATLPEAPTQLAEAERQQAAGLMRVNHVGEICAQALYTAQALATRNPRLRAQYEAACAEEVDHLAWTAQRLDELGARPSLLNPLWYAGAFGLGLLAGGWRGCGRGRGRHGAPYTGFERAGRYHAGLHRTRCGE